jgi:putative transport protein
LVFTSALLSGGHFFIQKGGVNMGSSSCIVTIFLVVVAAFAGNHLGKLNVGKFSLGESGALVAGMTLPLFLRNYSLLIPSWLIKISLIFFIATVGLIAGKKIQTVIKSHGFKFALLGLSITFIGALTSYIVVLTLPTLSKGHAAGTYVGALTSSPGLASALESATDYGKIMGSNYSADVGIAYAISYPIGVLLVILSTKLLPQVFNIGTQNKELTSSHALNATADITGNKPVNMQKAISFVLSFAICCILGYLLGNIALPLYKIGYFKLGTTGGVLLSSLALGYQRKVFFLDFRINEKVLNKVRSLSLLIFLSSIGLKYGSLFFKTLSFNLIGILFASLVAGSISILFGFWVGHRIFKLDWPLLLGALCGGMTSTPGLGAAIEAVNSDEPVLGYGATYPFALFGMVLFTKMIFVLPAI